MKTPTQIHKILLLEYGPQGWWPIVNNKTLICEYDVGAPRNEEEAFEIICGAILAQNTNWYPNVVRAIQQLKLGRPFKKHELEVIRKAEILKGKIFEKPKKITKPNILMQNTSWKNVEKAIANLNAAKILDVKKIQKANVKKIAELIRPSGYYNQKAERLKGVAGFLQKRGMAKLRKMETEQLRNLLLQQKGIGPETADSIVLYAFEKPSFVVDAYTRRIFSQLGIFRHDLEYERIRQLFMNELPKDVKIYKEYHALIVEHAKRYYSRKPYGKDCPLKTMLKK